MEHLRHSGLASTALRLAVGKAPLESAGFVSFAGSAQSERLPLPKKVTDFKGDQERGRTADLLLY